MKSLILLVCMVIALTQGLPADVTCNFETGVCSWQNTAGDLWMWSSGTTSGDPDKPTRDVTLSNHDGHYVYAVVSANDLVPTFISPLVQTGEAVFCFRLSVYSTDASEAVVKVSVLETGQPARVVEIANTNGDKVWTQDGVEITVHNDFNIQLEGVLFSSAARAVIAVDEIKLSKGHCPNQP